MKTEDSAETLWGLDEQSRLPLKPAGWELVDTGVVLTRPQRFDGGQPYASHAFPFVDDQIIAGVKQLLEEWPEDFEVAASSIKPEAWRLLFYRGFYTAEALTAFRFHAEPALRRLCATDDDDGGDPPAAWLGTDRRIEDISTELEMTLCEIGEKPASAAWLILCLAQRANLTQSEISQCTWSDPVWIRGFLEHVRLAP